MADIFVKGKEIGSCPDDLGECPEDAIWHRDLEDIFWLGVRAGLEADSKGDIEVRNISEPH